MSDVERNTSLALGFIGTMTQIGSVQLLTLASYIKFGGKL